jgi:hypothetical protein
MADAYIDAKCEPYDFDPTCDIEGCGERASQGMRCMHCGEVPLMLCGAHAGRSERNLQARKTPVQCRVCQKWGDAGLVFEFRPLSGWFS